MSQKIAEIPSTQSALDEYIQHNRRQIQFLDQQVQLILSENRIRDLEQFLKKRHSLHNWNQLLQYLFLFTQASGILIVSISNAMQLTYLVWVGAGLNLLAGVFQGVQHVNAKLSKRLFKDLENIKKNQYIDEGIRDPETAVPESQGRSDATRNFIMGRFDNRLLQNIPTPRNDTAEFKITKLNSYIPSENDFVPATNPKHKDENEDEISYREDKPKPLPPPLHQAQENPNAVEP
jgi:hypothetical protein